MVTSLFFLMLQLIHKSLQIVWSLCLVMLVTLISATACSQSLSPKIRHEVDSLNNIIATEKEDEKKVILYLDVANRYLFSDIDSCLKYLKSAEVLGIKTGYKFGLANCYAYYGIVTENQGDLVKALEYYTMSVSLAYAIGDVDLLTYGFLNTGGIYYHQGDAIGALNSFYKALKISEKTKNAENTLEALMNIATVFENQMEADKALRIRLKCLAVAEEMESPYYIAQAKSSIATAYRFRMQAFMKENESMDSVLYYKELALKYGHEEFLFAQETGNLLRMAKHYVFVGLIHKKMAAFMEVRSFPQDSINSEYHAALENFGNALDLHVKQGDKKGMAYCNQYIADIYFSQGNITRALPLAEKSLAISEEAGVPMNIKQSADLLYQIYKESGNYKGALEMHEKFIVMRDSMINESTLTDALKIEFQHENEKKEEQKNALEKEQKLQQLNLQKQRYIIAGLVVITLLILLISLLLFRNKNIRHRQRAIDLEQKLLRSQMNPHFIFNSLNSIQRMYVEGDKERANDYMGDFSTLLRRILESSSKKYITLKEELNTLEVYLEMEKIRTNGLINYQIVADESMDVFNYIVPPLIIQPFVENAIWHGIIPAKRSGNIKIELIRKNSKYFYCLITDNGVGIGNSNSGNNSKHDSKGILISRERLGSAGNVLIENIESGGTRVTLTIPIQK